MTLIFVIAIAFVFAHSAQGQQCSGTRSSIGCALISDADVCAEAKCNSENGGCVENPANPPCSAITVERACTAVRCTWGAAAAPTTTTTTTAAAAGQGMTTTTADAGGTASNNMDSQQVSGVIVGAVVGINVLIVLLAMVMFIVMRKKRESAMNEAYFS